MIRRLLLAGLALFALRRLIVVAGALLAAGMLVTSGGERRSARPPAPSVPPAPPPPAGPRADAAVAIARAYALAARNWTPTTYPAAWRRQRQLATGALRRELDATRPTRAQLRALRTDLRSSLAVATRTRRAPAVRASRARVTIWLAERTTVGTQAVAAMTRNTVRLRRAAGGWRVTGWSTIPGSAEE